MTKYGKCNPVLLSLAREKRLSFLPAKYGRRLKRPMPIWALEKRGGSLSQPLSSSRALELPQICLPVKKNALYLSQKQGCIFSKKKGSREDALSSTEKMTMAQNGAPLAKGQVDLSRICVTKRIIIRPVRSACTNSCSGFYFLPDWFFF